MGATDLRVVKTLRQIDEALLACIAEQPFREVTLGKLCQRAMINKTTFYKYYLDKYDCLNRYLDRLMDEFRAHIAADFVLTRPDQIGTGSYRAHFSELTDFVYSRRREYRVVWQAQIDRKLFEEMTQAMGDAILGAAGAQRSEGRRRIHLELYARLFSVHAMSLFDWWLQNEDSVDAAEVRRLMDGNMKNGLFATFRRYYNESPR